MSGTPFEQYNSTGGRLARSRLKNGSFGPRYVISPTGSPRGSGLNPDLVALVTSPRSLRQLAR